MAWLTTPSIWYRRKLITVNGSTSGALSDYQMKLIVNQASGTDSSGIVNLGGNVLITFNDLRFTKSDGTTLLNYWIESITGISPNQTATVWIKLAPSPDTIPVSPGTYSLYIYYNNILASASSSGTNTFVVYNGLDTFIEVDPVSKYTITPTKITITGAVTGEASGTHKTIDALTGFIAEFEYLSTGWSYPVVYVPFMFGDAYINSNYAANIGTYNGIGMEMVSTAISTLSIYAVKWVNGVRTEGTYYTIPSGTNFYIRVTRIGTTYTLNVFSNPQRTTNYGGSPTSVTVANTSWNILGLAVNDLWVPGDWTGRYQSYYVQNVIIRKYASPEPTFSTTSPEQVYTATYFTSTPTGATIWVDDTNLGTTTPATVVGLTAGSHTYRLIEVGYTNRGNFSTIAGQTTNVSATLTAVGLNGSIWIEDQYLCYINTSNVVTYTIGTSSGAVAGLAGSIWIEGTQLAYIDASNNKRLLPVTTLGTVAGLDGSLWIDGNYLYYIASGTQRYVTI